MCKKLVMLTVLLVLLCAAALAEGTEPQEEWNGYDYGHVLCETLTMRRGPDTSAEAVKTLPYGSSLTITEQQENWYYAVSGQDEGWVRSEYVLVNPSFFCPSGETIVYALPDTAAKRVGLLDGTEGVYAIIAEYGDFLAISLRGACGFVLPGPDDAYGTAVSP